MRSWIDGTQYREHSRGATITFATGLPGSWTLWSNIDKFGWPIVGLLVRCFNTTANSVRKGLLGRVHTIEALR
jgi:hypothetical protein